MVRRTLGDAQPEHYDLMYAREALAYGLRCLLDTEEEDLKEHANTIIGIITSEEEGDRLHTLRENVEWDMSGKNFYGSLTKKAKDGSMTREIFIETMIDMAPVTFKVPFTQIMTVTQLRNGDPPNMVESFLGSTCKLFWEPILLIAQHEFLCRPLRLSKMIVPFFDRAAVLDLNQNGRAPSN